METGVGERKRERQGRERDRVAGVREKERQGSERER